MKSRLVQRALIVPLLAGFVTCASDGQQGVRFTEPPSPRNTDALENWPGHPDRVAELMARGEFEILSVEGAGAGTTGAEKVKLRFAPGGEEFSVKTKVVPGDLDGINNSPRKELAAWKLQALFLDPEDYTVPSTSVRCVTLDQWKQHHRSVSPTLSGTNCVLLVVSVWLDDVSVPDVLYNERRFLDEPDYAYFLSNFNILGYLINLRDNRGGNVLVANRDGRRRVFSVDNGVSFGTFWYNWFYPPTFFWREIRVPALPKQSVDRLRALRREDIDSLLVVSQLELDADGILWSVEPGEPLDPDDGTRRDGTTVQFGLTADEVASIWQRITSLLDEIDAGRIGLF